MINVNEAHNWILGKIKKNYGSFISPGEIDEAIHSGSLDIFNQQVKFIRDSGQFPDILKNFRKTSTATPSSGIVSIASPDAEITAAAAVIDGVEYPARVARTDEEWLSRNLTEEEIGMEHLLRQEQEYALTAASDRYQDLPGNFNKEINIFYKDAQNNYSEGDILSEHEFTERIDSAILTPDTDHPIARIVDNSIEFYPKPSGADTYTYVLVYREFPNDKRPMVRVTGDNADEEVDVEVKPITVSSLKVYYLSKPIKPVFGYTSASGVVTYVSGTSTHLDWDYKAFNLIMTRALFYLGYAIKDGQVVEIPAARNAIESSQDQI